MQCITDWFIHLWRCPSQYSWLPYRLIRSGSWLYVAERKCRRTEQWQAKVRPSALHVTSSDSFLPPNSTRLKPTDSLIDLWHYKKWSHCTCRFYGIDKKLYKSDVKLDLMKTWWQSYACFKRLNLTVHLSAGLAGWSGQDAHLLIVILVDASWGSPLGGSPSPSSSSSSEVVSSASCRISVTDWSRVAESWRLMRHFPYNSLKRCLSEQATKALKLDDACKKQLISQTNKTCYAQRRKIDNNGHGGILQSMLI